MAHAQIAACPRLTGKHGRAATIRRVIATHAGLAPVIYHVSRPIGGRKGLGRNGKTIVNSEAKAAQDNMAAVPKR